MVRGQGLIGALVFAILAALVAGVGASAAASAALPGVELATEPKTTTPLDGSGHDYAVRGPCRPLRFSGHAKLGTRVSIDGSPPRGGDFTVAIKLAGGEGTRIVARRGGTTSAIHVRCLPEGFPPIQFERFAKPAHDWYVVTPRNERDRAGFAIVLNGRGVPVWFSAPGANATGARLLAGGRIAWAHRVFYGDQQYTIRSLDGHVLDRVATVGSPTDPHDFLEIADGRYLVLTYKRRSGVDLSPYGGPADATVVDGEIQEVDRDGNLLWSWNSADHIGLEEAARWYPFILARPLQPGTPDERYDIAHINSIELDGNSLIASFRYFDAIYSIDRASGAINWKLGGTATSQSLDLHGDPEAPDLFGGQHDARLLSDGTVSAYDNATGRGYRPRAVRYAIHPRAATARLLESVVDPLVTDSPCCGNATHNRDGSWTIDWGRADLISEFGPGGQRRFNLRFGSRNSYRVAPADSDFATISQLRAGMDAMHPSPSAFECGLTSAANRVVGEAERDQLHGTPRPDVILGYSGADSLFGRASGDCLFGAAGRDRLRGGGGGDVLVGGQAASALNGGSGADLLVGGFGGDSFDGGGGADRISGGAGPDRIRVGGNATVSCGSGRDLVVVRGKTAFLSGDGCEVIRPSG